MTRMLAWLCVLPMLFLFGCDQALDLLQSTPDAESIHPGLLLVRINVKDADKFNNEYFPKAGETNAAAGGRGVLKGVNPEGLHGENDKQVLVDVKVPSQDAIHTWLHSPEDQALIPERTEAADMNLTYY